MRDSNLRICLMLFISARFSIAHKARIIDPNETFAHTASIHSLFVREPNQDELVQYVSTKLMFLGLHRDKITFSIYESDAPYTFFTFYRRHVDFELLYAETMAFNVKEENDIWYFQCTFSDDRSTLDFFFSSLSAHTGDGSTSYRMNINVLESYVKTDQMQDPIIEAVKDLQPAMLYDQDLQGDDYQSLKKIYSITPLASEDTKRPTSRLVFRTGDFQMTQVKDKVVLKLSACTNWFYIFYFRNAHQARRFAKYLSLGPLDSLDLPHNLRLYVETGSPHPQTESQSSRKQSRPGEGSSMEIDCEDEKPKRRKPRVEFSEQQLKRLREEFKTNSHPTKAQHHQLALELGLQNVEVKNWFHNERDRERK